MVDMGESLYVHTPPAKGVGSRSKLCHLVKTFILCIIYFTLATGWELHMVKKGKLFKLLK